MNLTRIISLVAIAPFLSSSAFAGEASGEFKVEGRRPITPKHAAAYETRDQRDARKRLIEIALTSAPIDIKDVATALDPHAAAINDNALRDDHYVLLWVRHDGSVTMNATYSDSMSQYIDMTSESLRAELTTNTAEKIEGRIYTPNPVKTMGGESYAVDLKFSTTVSRMPAGTKLGAGGAEVGAGFKNLTAAVAKKNWDAIKAALTPEQVASFDEDYRTPEENLDYALDILNAWLPKKSMKIVGGELHGDTAVLEVEGELYEGQKALYLVEMKKNGAKWLFARAVTAGLLR